jgi:membrane protein YdbS with pleckstrin-like domain
MKSLTSLVCLLALSSVAFADHLVGHQDPHSSTWQTVIYVIIAAVMLMVIFSVLWRSQKRKFNE